MAIFTYFFKYKIIHLPSIVLVSPLLLFYSVNCFAEALPRNYINQTQTFVLECPNNPQHTTYDMDTCNGTIINQLKAVQEKYIAAIQHEIQSQYQNDPALLKETMDAFDKENKTWNMLLDATADATFSYWQQGTIRGVMSTGRKIELMKYRIHNQWKNWLTSMSLSEPALLPEPLFDIRN